MDDEKIDIIDKNGKVLNECLKSEAHEKGFLHAIVLAMVVRSNGNFVLVRNAVEKQDPGQWVSTIGGHIWAGEEIEVALRREVREETGLTEYEIQHIGDVIFRRDVTVHEKFITENHLFHCHYVYTDEKVTLNEEATEYKNFSINEIIKELKDNPENFGDLFRFLFENLYLKFPTNNYGASSSPRTRT